MKGKNSRHIIEFIAWTGFIVFPLILFPTMQPFVSDGQINPVFKGLLITHSLLIVYYYFNFYFALPRLYFRQKYPRFVAITFSCLLLLILVLQLDSGFNPLPTPPFHYAKVAFIFSIVVRFVLVFLLSMGVLNYQRLKLAEAEKLKSELSYLKAQINPHFLFNTLNSIYALTVKKSDTAPQAVTKLASIMRYVITDAAQDYVPLEKEINYISSYIELEKLRLSSKARLSYTISGNSTGRQISPMVFVPLIENAFKHGVSTSEESEIEINIGVLSRTLSVNVKNKKVRHDKTNSNGLGIANVKKRLNLMYNGRYDLQIKENEQEFSVTLVLILND